MPRILVFTTYPFNRPLHGGQLRAANLAAAYRAAGFEVQTLAVYQEEHYTDVTTPDDVAFPRHSPFRLYRGASLPFVDDLLSGAFAAADTVDGGGYAQVRSRLRAPPDAIHLEQPWLLPLAERLLAEPEFERCRLVYGSQNVEWQLKQQILDSYAVAGSAPVVEEIRALEARACARADLVLAVAEADLAALQALGARKCLLARNGIAAATPSAAALERWQRQFDGLRFALFVGSAHPPNISGFIDVVGPSLAFLPPDRAICIAGGVGPHIRDLPQLARWSLVNAPRLRVLGILSDDDLAAVKALAHIYILPIREGSGSNIKTAEALNSGKPVVGTSVSFRGYEAAARELAGVYVEDDADGFRQRVTRLLESEARPPAPAQAALRNSLLWERTLADVPGAVLRCIGSRA
ncbi:MAG: glycosyltransferase [Sterolibacterium sp.]|nr:glycosyltransferase [Sterolibacterium sp.]